MKDQDCSSARVRTPADRMYRPIEAYGLVGNCHTGALISSNGSVDWMCVPRFDSPSIFGRILDLRKGGYWVIRPTGQHHSNHYYADETSVLVTRFLMDDGVVHLTDFMPIGADSGESGRGPGRAPRALIRIVEGMEGEVEIESVCAPRPDYGRAQPRLSSQGRELGFAGYKLIAPSDWRVDHSEQTAVTTLTVRGGERFAFILWYAPEEGVSDADPYHLLDATTEFWKKWAAQCTYEGPYRDEVVRSALTLRMLIYAPTGAVLAAPTTSLPEELGGSLNWDYRYTWIRDASLTLYALLLAGFEDETDAFFRWIAETVRLEKTGIRIMYPVAHETNLEEQELDHWEGYFWSRPVRIGNGAHDQLQLDVYGEVLDALHFAWQTGRYDPSGVWDHFRPLVDWVADNWDQPDNGIWEIRGDRKNYVYSKVMCWVALDRGVKIARGNNLEGDVERWKRERDRIRLEVLERGWSAKLGAFKQSYEDERLDASNLRLLPVGFLGGDDEQMGSTIDRTLDRLVTNQLCYRYLDSGSPAITGSEGSFLVCTFWLVNALVLAHRLDEAQDMFENSLHYASPLGLYAEEMDPSSRQQIGNFPQALSHIGLISSAVQLAHAGKAGRVQAHHSEAATRARRSGSHQRDE